MYILPLILSMNNPIHISYQANDSLHLLISINLKSFMWYQNFIIKRVQPPDRYKTLATARLLI
jgi:hypothetical protein